MELRGAAARINRNAVYSADIIVADFFGFLNSYGIIVPRMLLEFSEKYTRALDRKKLPCYDEGVTNVCNKCNVWCPAVVTFWKTAYTAAEG